MQNEDGVPCKIQLERQADSKDGKCDWQAIAVKSMPQNLLLYNSIAQQSIKKLVHRLVPPISQHQSW